MDAANEMRMERIIATYYVETPYAPEKAAAVLAGIAGAMGKLGTVGLAAAVFSPWMNISGSILANYWKRRPVDDKERST